MLSIAGNGELTGQQCPADIQYFIEQVAHFAFEQELKLNENYPVIIDTFIQMKEKVAPSLSSEMIEEFKKDCIKYSRV